jgi:acetylornithine deacetylase/succinyl-diaminopimelate desuccinylase-like protein
MVYLMYDVKQVTKEKWTLVRNPFEPKICEVPSLGKAIVGRGAVNSKGPLQAMLNAVGEIVCLDSHLPVNLKFLAEGEEELGSPNLWDFVSDNGHLFSDVSGVLVPNASQDVSGNVSIYLGSKGLVELELECSGHSWGRGPTGNSIHSSYAPVVESPVWRMIRALASMKDDPDDSERVTVQDFYKDVNPPTRDDVEMLNRLSERVDIRLILNSMGVLQPYKDLASSALLKRLLLEPTLNVQGIYGGYTGRGFDTVLPESIRVKLESRLVPQMTAETVIMQILGHLKAAGFEDIRVVRSSGDLGRFNRFSKVDPRSGLIDAGVRAYRSLGYDPLIWPTSPATAPLYVFTEPPLKLPVLSFGLGHGGNAHAPDEYFLLDDKGTVKGLAGCEKSFVRLLFELGDSGNYDA